MRRPWKVALVAGLVGLVLGFLLRDLVGSPGEKPTRSTPAVPAPPVAAQDVRASEPAAPARIDTVPYVAHEAREGDRASPPSLGAIVTGRIWDPAGALADRARVTLHGSAIEGEEEPLVYIRETRSDDQGRYALIAEPGWQVQVRVGYGGCLDATLPPRQVVAGINTLEDVFLSQGLSVSGTVRDGNGQPVDDVRVVARFRHPKVLSPRSWGFFREARTDPVGRFTFGAVDPIFRIHVAADHPALLGQPVVQQADAGATDVDFVLREGGVIRGRVTGIDAAVRHTLVVRFLVSGGPEGPDARGRPIGDLIPGGGTPPSSGVDGDDQFQIQGLDACAGDLLVTQDLSLSPARIYDTARLRGLSVGPGEVLEGLDIAMSPAPAVDGRVVDERGQGVPGIRIDVNGGDPWRNPLQFTVSTDAKGRFHFPGVPRIPLRIEADETSGLICRPLSDFVSGSGEAIVRLSRPATLEGSIPEHLLADEHLIHFEPLGPLGMVRNWPARPKFSCTGLWPGRYRIQLIDEKGQVIEELGTVLLRPGETTQLP